MVQTDEIETVLQLTQHRDWGHGWTTHEDRRQGQRDCILNNTIYQNKSQGKSMAYTTAQTQCLVLEQDL